LSDIPNLLPPPGTPGYVIIGELDDAIIQYFDCISTAVKILIKTVVEPWISIRFLPEGFFVVREESEEGNYE
jgi:hypothetical protein